jgi:hypothetical protein
LASPVGLAGILRGESHYEVEPGREFADLGSIKGLEGHGDEFLQLGVPTAESLVEKVVGVLFFTLDVELSGKEALVPVGDCNMDVRGASGIGRRFDGAEVIVTLGICKKATIALEVLVPLVLSVGLGMEVDTLVVDLPDLDDGIADRLTLGVQHNAGEVTNGTDCGGDLVVDDEEIVIGIEGKVVRVERPLRVPGCAGESLRKGAGYGEEGGGSCEGAAKKVAAVAGWATCDGIDGSHWLGVLHERTPGKRTGCGSDP